MSPVKTDRRCYNCKQIKPLTAFRKHKSKPGGRAYLCTECDNANSYSRHLKRAYDLTELDYDELYDKQEGRCALCHRNNKKLCVDHDHTTGRVRGLLCYRCNKALGALGDSPESIRQALKYVSE